MYSREEYLKQLTDKMNNGRIKIITGIRRCGKSFLLNKIFHHHLLSINIPEDHIIELSLEDVSGARYCNPFELDSYIRSLIKDRENYYVLLDEIQNVISMKNPWILEGEAEDRIGFPEVLMGLMKIPNVDLYVTGSNSKMLSTDVVTQFRDRGDEIHLDPLSFKEFYENYEGSREDAWRDYYTYGGLPRAAELKTHQEKAEYLNSLFRDTYLKDVMERHDIRNEEEVLDDLLNFVSSSIGSLSNPARLSNSFLSQKHRSVSSAAIRQYLDYFKEAYLIRESKRYDVKGRKYIGTPLKYYFTDMGLRNSRLDFSQIEENHLMENIIYNELIHRGYSVDIGVVEHQYIKEDGRKTKTMLEVDFIARRFGELYYIQSALHVDTDEKKKQELNSLLRINDSFRKIVIIKDHIMPYIDEHGILFIGVMDFLLKEDLKTM